MWSNSEKMAKNAYEFLFRQTEASKQRQSVPENPKKIGSICPDELIRLDHFKVTLGEDYGGTVKSNMKK